MTVILLFLFGFCIGNYIKTQMIWKHILKKRNKLVTCSYTNNWLYNKIYSL
ncbi:hypothetical protein rpr22_0014 [Rickettsia prowazekii str. Rp22]|uniref:Uncharacterized protein n=1 Tax=Rickettsia prowazekii (strain Rp22) TaxID=449216 RepID=D5AVT8_RICPP|nr:hypothetical protein rpr22_0014 [Rickettsia prowazekii str. Rp22]